ncbi:MAG: hypothetical protein IT381_02740 [Deltaproteobacteria bacterium]|nr:hypothetical protein [Deltaproteobacteria bacterium]
MIRALALLALAVAAFAVNGVLLTAPGCRPTLLTVSVALFAFAPFFVGVQHAAAHATEGALSRHATVYEALAGASGVLAIALGLSFAPLWALACPS